MRRAVLYRHFDAEGRLLYVGASMNVMQRILQHSGSSWWFPDIVRIELEHMPDAATAKLAEIEAILTEKPLYNINHTDRRPSVINREIAETLSIEQIEAAEADYHDMDQAMESVSMKHRIGLSTLGFLFGMRGNKTKSPWRQMRGLW